MISAVQASQIGSPAESWGRGGEEETARGPGGTRKAEAARLPADPVIFSSGMCLLSPLSPSVYLAFESRFPLASLCGGGSRDLRVSPGER